MTDWMERLTDKLEPVLLQKDPRAGLSAYHDMPFAIFLYPPEDEFSLRPELTMLKTRLEQAGKRVTIISLAKMMDEALRREGVKPQDLADAEKLTGLEKTVETIHEILSSIHPLDELVAESFPADADPLKDVVFIVRAGALFPIYRTSALLEQLKGRVHVPAVLFYPGVKDGASGLRFMGVLDADHNYRPKIL